MKKLKFVGVASMAIMLMVVMMFTGCKKEEATISGIKISSAAESLGVGSTVTLSYTCEPTEAKAESAVWSSSSEAVAKVDQNGVVTGVAAGTATITIKVNGQFTATCAVTVVVTNPVVTTAAKVVSTSGGYKFAYSITKNKDASKVRYIFSLLDEVADLSDDDLIKYIGKYGLETTEDVPETELTYASAWVRLTVAAIPYDNTGNAGALSKSIATPELPPVTAITISSSSESLKVGSTVALSYTYEPAKAKVESAVWSSSSAAVAKVDQNGLVTAVSAGTATITITVNGKFTKTCEVTVQAPSVTAIKISSSAETIKVGSTVQLSYTYEPTDAKIESAVWSSSSAAVATVDQNGLVKGIGAGTATITITVNGKFTKTCAVTVQGSALLSGKFSVSATKQVRFTKGNLYWDGSNFKFEASQTASPAASNNPLDASHVGHFFWTKTASTSYAATYNDGTCGISDKFFADGSDAGHTLTVDGQSGLYALSKAEWAYLLSADGRGVGDSKFKLNVTVCGVTKCLVIAPDNYSGTIASSYDAAAWSTAESAGLICLPPAGYRGNLGSGPTSVGNGGYYWLATASGNETGKAYYMAFDYSDINCAVEYNRSFGCAVRLVSTVTK